MKKELHLPKFVIETEEHDFARDDAKTRTKIILEILADAEPEGVDKEDFKRTMEEKGIMEAELAELLEPLIRYANIYFNENKGKYHYMWSSSIQYE